MGTFTSQGLSFEIDRTGVELQHPEIVQLDIACEDAAIAADDAPTDLGRRLSRLLGEHVVDEEGIFDLAVTQGGELVAALVLACEGDVIALGGERTQAVSDEDLATALVGALRGAAA